MYKCPICGENVDDGQEECPKCRYHLLFNRQKYPDLDDKQLASLPLNLHLIDMFFLPEKFYILKSWLYILFCGIAGMILSIIPIVVCADVGYAFSNVAFFVIAAIGVIAALIVVFVHKLNTDGFSKEIDGLPPADYSVYVDYENSLLRVKDGDNKRLPASVIYWRYPRNGCVKSFWTRLFFLHLPIGICVILLPLLIDLPVAVGCLLFYLLVGSALLFGYSVSVIGRVNKYKKNSICPKCGRAMVRATLSSDIRSSTEQTGGKAKFRNVKIGEAKFEDGSSADVYGQQTYYTPVRTCDVTTFSKEFNVVCPHCQYSDGKAHSESRSYRSQIN